MLYFNYFFFFWGGAEVVLEEEWTVDEVLWLVKVDLCFDLCDLCDFLWDDIVLLAKNLGIFVPVPRLMLAIVTLTTVDVDGIAVTVNICSETGGVIVTKLVDVSVLGVKKVVVVCEVSVEYIVVIDCELITFTNNKIGKTNTVDIIIDLVLDLVSVRLIVL